MGGRQRQLNLGCYSIRDTEKQSQLTVGAFFRRLPLSDRFSDIESKGSKTKSPSSVAKQQPNKRLAVANNTNPRTPSRQSISTLTSSATQEPSKDETSQESFVINLNPASLSFNSSEANSSNITLSQSSHTSIQTGNRPEGNQFQDRTSYYANRIIRKKVYPKQVPHDKIMSGVVFVMSGFENPRRGNLRDLAIQMGAKYQPKWNRHCTHLICAFKNTPKYKEVMAEDGRVVREHWIQECARHKKLLDWREYKLGKYPYPDSEEEVDIVDQQDQVPDDQETDNAGE